MKRVVDVKFEAVDEPLTVTYDRDALGRAIADSGPPALLANRLWHVRLSASVDVLVEAIVSWNLGDDEGRTIPISRESFNKLPIGVLSADRLIDRDGRVRGRRLTSLLSFKPVRPPKRTGSTSHGWQPWPASEPVGGKRTQPRAV